jgi:hypothetical protein
LGGPSASTRAQQSALVNAQTAEAQSLTNLSNAAIGNYQSETAPLVNYDQGLIKAANSGDYSQVISANAPAITNVNQQAAAAKQNIIQSIPAGPGRDAALAALPAQTGSQVASTLNSGYQNALSQLATIGNQSASIGLQGAGGALSGLQGASGSNVQLGQMQAAASPWNIVSSLAGGLGQAASGTNFKAGSGGGAASGAGGSLQSAVLDSFMV